MEVPSLEFIHHFSPKNCLCLKQGSIIDEKVDAIVNAANEHLLHGGGVAAAIVRAGGKVIQQESQAWVEKHGIVTHTSPAYTSGGILLCRYVIHAVGPIWGSGDEDNKLNQAIFSSMELAETLEIETIAFPPISTGIFGFPKERASYIFFDTIKAYFSVNRESKISQVNIVIIDQATWNVFYQAFTVWKKKNLA